MLIIKNNNSGSGEAGNTVEPGDVLITTQNFKEGYLNLSYSAYAKRKTESNISQTGLYGPCLDFNPICSDIISDGNGINSSSVYKINSDEYITISSDKYFNGFKDNVNVKIDYIFLGEVQSTVQKTFSISSEIESMVFNSVCNYNDALYFFKDNLLSIDKSSSTEIYKVEIDQTLKQLTEVSTITTVPRKIIKSFYNKEINKYVSIENNIISNPVVTATELLKCGIFIDDNFEDINVLTNTTAFFNLEDANTFITGFSTAAGTLSNEEAIKQFSNYINISLFAKDENNVYIYNQVDKKYNKIVDFNQVSEDYIVDYIDMLDMEDTKTRFLSVQSIFEYKDNIIIKSLIHNEEEQSTASYYFKNKTTNIIKKIYFENVEAYIYNNFLLINGVTNFNTFEQEMAIVMYYNDLTDSTVQRKAITINGYEHLRINNKTINDQQAFYISPFNYGLSQYINNEDEINLIDNIGAIDYQTRKLCKVEYSQFSFPFVYVQKITNAPIGLNYLLKL